MNEDEDIEEEYVMTPDEIAYFLVVREDHKTCEACPTQWEGALKDGRTFYFRYRHGYASLTVSEPDEDNYLINQNTDRSRYFETHPNGMADGYMDNQQYRTAFMHLYRELEKHDA